MIDLNAADRWRERQRWIPAWLDNTDAKSWLWHTVVVLVLGSALGLVTPLSVPWGWRVIVAAYVVREVANRTTRNPLRFDYRYKPLDGVMDWLVPWAVVEALVWGFW